MSNPARTPSRLAWLLPIAGLATACGTSSPAGTTSSPQKAAVCASDPRAQVYTSDLEQPAQDGAVKVQLVNASPAPPSVGNNTWDIVLLDASGNPITGATVTAKPWMPDHNHGASVHPTATPAAGAGAYTLTPLDFFMPGIWQTTLTIDVKGQTTPVVFTFCVDG